MARRSSITLYSHPSSVQSHRVRLVMAEKGVANYDIVELQEGESSEDLTDLNPYQSIPTLVDRELVVYDPRIIIEYIDERYPHPPLMPVDPVSRAQYRLAIFRMESDLYALCEELESTPAVARKARARMTELLTTLAAGFSTKQFIGDEFSLLDCTLAPVLWRLEYYQVGLPARYERHIARYAEQLFVRPAFEQSLTAVESEMHSSAAAS